MRARTTLSTLFLVCAAAASAAGDSLFFKDGRYYEVPKLIEREKDFEVVYPHGSVIVAKELVQDFFCAEGGGSVEARTPEEAEKLALGLVPFEGKWIPKARRDQLVEKQQQERRAQLDEYRKHQEWRDRYQQDTKHFSFEFTVPLDVGRQYMDMFEVYYDTFAKEWKVQQPKGKKLKVCFYNKREDFTRIGNVSENVLGYFRFVDPIELNFFYERQDERLTLDVLFHELNHYLFFLHTKDNWQLEPWIEEGMAEYYGASQWDPTTKQMSLGHQQEGRLVILMDEMDGGENQDLEGLLRDSVFQDGIKYAWAWSLCHKLMENAKTRPKFKAYVDKLARGTAEREANPRNPNFMWVKRDFAIDQFKKTLGVQDLDAYEKEWYDYIRSMKVESARGYHAAAMFCKRWDRNVRAGVFFKKAIEGYTTNPSTYLGYGELLIEDDKAKEAIEVLQKGIQLDPMNPHMYRHLGEAYRKLADGDSKDTGKKYQLLAIDMDPYDSTLTWGLDSEVLAELGSGGN
ncbi:MAG: tetratricopeptide repeat protein [Planctomycetes bacterium]|nr:tetratricopeptide repeat protein [Planctomycetota bacterium]